MKMVAEMPEMHFQLALRLVIALESSFREKVGFVDGLEVDIFLAFASTYEMQSR